MSKPMNVAVALGIGLAPLAVGIPSAVAITPYETCRQMHPGYTNEELKARHDCVERLTGGKPVVPGEFAKPRKVHEERRTPPSSSNSGRAVLQAVIAVSLLGFAAFGIWYRKNHKQTDPIPAQPVYDDYLSTPVSYAPPSAPPCAPAPEPTPAPTQAEDATVYDYPEDRPTNDVGDGW